MRRFVPRISVVLGAILVLGACGTTASPSASAPVAASTEPAGRVPDLLAVVCAPMPKPFDASDIDLTGAWAGDDGGIYYLRQLGSVLWWNGMSERDASPMNLGRVWNNIGRGVINGLQIEVETADVPRGELLFNSTMILNIQDDGAGNIEIVKTHEVEGGFGNSVWTPCEPIELEVADYLQNYGGDKWEYADILTADRCDDLAERKTTVTTRLNSSEAGSPEFRAALGYSDAISERQLALDCSR